MARRKRKKGKGLFIKATAVDNDTGQKVHTFEGDDDLDFERDFVEPLRRKFR